MLATSPALQKAHASLRTVVATLGDDRYLAPDLEAAATLVGSGALASATGLALPELIP